MRTLSLLICLLAIALPAHAEKGHVHGEGSLEVVIDKGRLSLRLELPLDVAVGFERAPRSDKERAALAAAQQALADPALFVPTPAAGCKPEPVRIAMPTFDGNKPAAHADIDAAYEFSCATPAALKSVETTIFKSFKRLYRLDARRAGPTGQGAGRLTPKNPVLAW
ncbi:MAG: DUF2796 domain-containing protein [Rhodocyclales bacterium]|nr:DUF2796 domain-containing protein [Rhodocyclales bacterium]